MKVTKYIRGGETTLLDKVQSICFVVFFFLLRLVKLEAFRSTKLLRVSLLKKKKLMSL